MNSILYKISVALAIVSFLAGCAVKPYRGEAVNNVVFRQEVKSTPFIFKVKTFVDVYDVKPSCEWTYAGTIKLNKAEVVEGLPSGRESYLVFRFDTRSYLTGSSGSISYGTLFKPDVGRQYDIFVRYQDSIYNVVITELGDKRSAARPIEQREFDRCKAEGK